MGKMSGKSVLITGGNSGIGLAAARLLVSEGARVVVVGRDPASVENTARDLGGNSIGLAGDVANLADLERIFDRIASYVGKLDVVFANAGIAELAPIGSISEEMFDRLFDVNVKGLLFTVQKALPLLNDGGSIILTASVGHLMGVEGYSTYSATKAAVRSFARNWTMDLKDRRIRVNSISPGPTITQMGSRMGMTQQQAEASASTLLATIPMARFGNADETAAAVLFLASDDSSFITGIDLAVDGGLAQV